MLPRLQRYLQLEGRGGGGGQLTAGYTQHYFTHTVHKASLRYVTRTVCIHTMHSPRATTEGVVGEEGGGEESIAGGWESCKRLFEHVPRLETTWEKATEVLIDILLEVSQGDASMICQQVSSHLLCFCRFTSLIASYIQIQTIHNVIQHACPNQVCICLTEISWMWDNYSNSLTYQTDIACSASLKAELLSQPNIYKLMLLV